MLLEISILVNTDMRLMQQCFVLVFMSDWAVCQQHRLIQILDLPQDCVDPVELLHAVGHVFILSKASVLWCVRRLFPGNAGLGMGREFETRWTMPFNPGKSFYVRLFFFFYR